MTLIGRILRDKKILDIIDLNIDDNNIINMIYNHVGMNYLVGASEAFAKVSLMHQPTTISRLGARESLALEDLTNCISQKFRMKFKLLFAF